MPWDCAWGDGGLGADRDHVLVAAAAAVDEDVLVGLHALGELHAVVDGVRRLQRRDDPLPAIGSASERRTQPNLLQRRDDPLPAPSPRVRAPRARRRATGPDPLPCPRATAIPAAPPSTPAGRSRTRHAGGAGLAGGRPACPWSETTGADGGGGGADLGLAEGLHALEGLGVGDADVGGAARVLEPRVLRPHARVVEPRRDAVRLLDLPLLVLHSATPRVRVESGGLGSPCPSFSPPQHPRPAQHTSREPRRSFRNRWRGGRACAGEVCRHSNPDSPPSTSRRKGPEHEPLPPHTHTPRPSLGGPMPRCGCSARDAGSRWGPHKAHFGSGGRARRRAACGGGNLEQVGAGAVQHARRARRERRRVLALQALPPPHLSRRGEVEGARGWGAAEGRRLGVSLLPMIAARARQRRGGGEDPGGRGVEGGVWRRGQGKGPFDAALMPSSTGMRLTLGRRGGDLLAAGLDADDLDRLVADEGVEQPDGVGATPHARHNHVGQPPGLRNPAVSRGGPGEQPRARRAGRQTGPARPMWRVRGEGGSRGTERAGAAPARASGRAPPCR